MSLTAPVDNAARVVFVPVRHHSPVAARVVAELAERVRPDAVLIEGPSDFNDRIDELFLPHRLPIAIYSFVRWEDGRRRGAYYPFCVYSPEWQAVQAGRRLGAEVRFIDLPYAAIAVDDQRTHRYADAELRGGAYVAALCHRFGVDDFDALWDAMVEVDAGLSPEAYLDRVGQFCRHVRELDGAPGDVEHRREAFMAAEVRRALDRHAGRLLVVTGGYHAPAIADLLVSGATTGGAGVDADAGEPAGVERGVALTPYSYERLDALTGYEAGMPNPGFYHQVWRDGPKHLGRTHRTLMARVAKVLRERRQPISAADLIAAETTARGLAALRGHPQVWRRDLVDGIAGALIKEESGAAGAHPLVEAVHQVLRGGEHGRLAEGTSLPPLVRDLKRQLAARGLEPRATAREVELELLDDAGRDRSHLLHRARVLGIPGFGLVSGTDFTRRDDLIRPWERWRIVWTADSDAAAIEAAAYGSSVAEAVAARLTERAGAAERDAEGSARLLLEAARAGLDAVAGPLFARLADLIRQDGDFLGVVRALSHLLYLYRLDEALGTRGRGDVGALLGEAFTRGLWLLESLGRVAGEEPKVVEGVHTLTETFERCGHVPELDRAEFADVLGRVASDAGQAASVRGAATGALWRLGAAAGEQVCADLRLFADPSLLGDFLTGLFRLAREAAQRQEKLILGVDELLIGFSEEEFLEALPALRLAFTFFTPREKHHMALTLVRSLGSSASPAALDVSPAVAARALAFETQLFRAVERYGLRGNSP